MLDREGRKINDPRLEYYAKQGGLLVKEYSDKPVPLILLLGTQNPQTVSPSTAVTTRPSSGVRTTLPVSGVMKRGEGPALPTSEALSAGGPQPHSGTVSIHGMTMDQAFASGLLSKKGRNRPDPMDKAPDEDTSGAAARGAPYIDEIGRAQMLREHMIRQGNGPLKLKSAEYAVIDPRVDVVSQAMKTHARPALTEAQILANAAVDADEKVVALPPLPAASDALGSIQEGAPLTTSAPGVTEERLRGPKIEFDGKIFRTVKTLRAHLKAKFKDEALVDEAVQPFLK